jgi:diguanylate cyclase (GGDEF)-like protein
VTLDYRIEPARCVACMACARVCPVDAVAVSGAQVRIVDDACTRCGACLPACPHQAVLASGDVDRALELAQGGRAALLLGIEAAAFFHPATAEQVVNACYAAGFRVVQRGVVGDELVAREYLRLWSDQEWGTLIRSTCPVVVRQVRERFPELVPYLAPVTTPLDAEARYLRALHGAEVPIVAAGVCLGDGSTAVDATLTFDDLAALFGRRGVRMEEQAGYFTRIPEERRRHLGTAGGMPLATLVGERRGGRAVRTVRGLEHLEAIAQAVAVDRIDLGFVDILPCDDCLDHPLMGTQVGVYRRRQIVDATEPVRAAAPVVDPAVADRLSLGAVFPLPRGDRPLDRASVESVLAAIGTAPNGQPWDCGACGYATCRGFAAAASQGRASLKSCPPSLERQAVAVRAEVAQDRLTGLATAELLKARLASEVARSKRSGEPFALLFMDLDNFQQVNERHGVAAADALLRGAAEELAGLVRTTDLAARYGGDEFVVLLVRTGREGARVVAEKVRAGVERLGVTTSIGVAAFAPRESHQEDVLVAADRALYRAKAAGRNRVATGER